MEIPTDRKYLASHEWASKPEGDLVTVGITDFAQDQLGDVVYVELPAKGAQVSAGDAVAVVESVKTASDIYTPVSGEIAEVNEELNDNPELINTSPYGGGWIFKVRVSDASELDGLLDADAYRQVAEEA
jgi:glycine cleavage system H protein